MHVGFPQPRAADTHEPSFLQQLRNGGAPAIAHSGFQSANHLIDDHRDRAAVGNAAFDALRNQFREAIRFAVRCRDSCRGITLGALKITLARSLGHGAKRSHAAIRLERPPLVQDQFAGTLSSVPAKSEPIMTELAPAANALVTSPE